jgi:hypothetical protein
LTADEIMHVLRLTAMGRVNHPDQARLCEALEKVLREPAKDPMAGRSLADIAFEIGGSASLPAGVFTESPIKQRTRKQKAD